MSKYQVKYPIKVLSYNIYFKAMLGLDKNFLPKETAQKNVKNIIESGDYEIIGLQEVECFNKIFDSKTLAKYNYVSGKSGKETLMTFFKKKYNIIDHITTDFHEGRPLQIVLVKDGSQLLLVVNLHAPHETQNFGNYNGKENRSNYHYSLELIKIINEKINNFVNNQIDRIILIGDFNELYHNSDNNSFEINIRGKKYQMRTQKIISCCYPNIHKPGDYIFDSEIEPKLNIVSDIHPASDHFPVDSIL